LIFGNSTKEKIGRILFELNLNELESMDPFGTSNVINCGNYHEDEEEESIHSSCSEEAYGEEEISENNIDEEEVIDTNNESSTDKNSNQKDASCECYCQEV
jgi:hypothetical protein